MLAVGGALFLVGTTDPLTTIQVPIVSAVLNQVRVQGANFGSADFTRDIPVSLGLYGRGRMNLDISCLEKSAWTNFPPRTTCSTTRHAAQRSWPPPRRGGASRSPGCLRERRELRPAFVPKRLRAFAMVGCGQSGIHEVCRLLVGSGQR